MPTPPNGRLAIFPGSFDPLTNGHVDIVLRSAHLFERILVAVLVNPDKKPLFTPDERVAIIGPTTQVFDALGQPVIGDPTAALLDADSLSLKALLQQPATWATDEDGAPVPTFAISRADITD